MEDYDIKTRLIHTARGRGAEIPGRPVNPPIEQGSTVVFDTLEAYHEAERARHIDASYGISGMATHRALEDALSQPEGGRFCLLTPSGLAAITLAISAFAQAGEELLVTDTAYYPTRRFCDHLKRAYGINTRYFDPLITAPQLEDMVSDKTRIIFLESPGSLTFELHDTRALTDAVKRINAGRSGDSRIITMFDNSYATPLFFRPLEHGADIVIQAATKFIAGHSDLLLGAVITSDEALHEKLANMHKISGMSCSAYDASLALRGLRSLDVRMERHERTTCAVLDFLMSHHLVAHVLHPSLEGHPGHEFWKRDIGRLVPLISIVMDSAITSQHVCDIARKLKLFSIGASWGGYESLVLDFNPNEVRSATRFPHKGQCLRLYLGLEDSDDLIADLAQGFYSS